MNEPERKTFSIENEIPNEVYIMSRTFGHDNIWKVYKERLSAIDINDFDWSNSDVKHCELKEREKRFVKYLLKVLFFEQTRLSTMMTMFFDAPSRSVMGLLLNSISRKIELLSLLVNGDNTPNEDKMDFTFDNLSEYLHVFKLSIIMPLLKVLKLSFPKDSKQFKIMEIVYNIELKDISCIVSFLRNTIHNEELGNYKPKQLKLGLMFQDIDIEKLAKFYISKVKGECVFYPDIKHDDDFDLDIISKEISPLMFSKLKKESKISFDEDF